MSDTLNAKQTAFVREYLIDSNGKQAAIRAGYAPKNAEVRASELLRKSKVKSLLAEKTEVLEEEAGMRAIDAMEEVRALATSNIMDGMEYDPGTREFTFKSPDQIPKEFWKACSELTTYQLPEGGGLAIKVKMHPKLQALKMEYDRHKLVGQDVNINNFAIGHVNQLQVNAAMRRAGMKTTEE
jgi:phage terminase small subunit